MDILVTQGEWLCRQLTVITTHTDKTAAKTPFRLKGRGKLAHGGYFEWQKKGNENFLKYVSAIRILHELTLRLCSLF